MNRPMVALFIVSAALAARADDWPQWRGPERTGVSKEKGLLEDWPKDGPKLLWENKDLGGGYSTPAIVGDRVYLMSSTKDEESAVALDVKDGQPIWAAKGGKVGKVKQYVQCVQGGVIGVEAKTGKFLWRYDQTKDQAANIPTPVFHDDCVFTSTSRNGSGLTRLKAGNDSVSAEEVYFNKTPI